MSRRRRIRTKSDRAILTAAAVLGIFVLVAGSTLVSYAHSLSLSNEAPPAEKSKFEITANDNGKTITFPLHAQFSVFLDEGDYPQEKLSCLPAGYIVHASDMPVATAPLYAVRFDTIYPGSCQLTDKDFSVKIVVED